MKHRDLDGFKFVSQAGTTFAGAPNYAIDNAAVITGARLEDTTRISHSLNIMIADHALHPITSIAWLDPLWFESSGQICQGGQLWQRREVDAAAALYGQR